MIEHTALGYALVDKEIRAMLASGAIEQKDQVDRVQPASLDLGIEAGTIWEMAGIPNLTEEFSTQTFVERYAYHAMELGPKGATLTRGRVYLLPLATNLHLPADVVGFANPKSSTGRIDAHVMLISEGGREFNVVDGGYDGQLFMIVVPQSFPIIVRPGDSLCQLRLFQEQRQFLDGKTEVRRLHERYGIVANSEKPRFATEGVLLHLDLRCMPANVVANPSGKPIDLAARGTINPRSYFREKPLDEHGALFLEPDEFVMASTVERLRIPPFLCAEMVPFDERQGEIRTHYAGFFDPGFGWGENAQGAAVVCEIRNIGTAPVILSHGQPICLFRFEYLRDIPQTLYGKTAAQEKSNYQFQEKVTLAKYFAPWHAEMAGGVGEIEGAEGEKKRW